MFNKIHIIVIYHITSFMITFFRVKRRPIYAKFFSQLQIPNSYAKYIFVNLMIKLKSFCFFKHVNMHAKKPFGTIYSYCSANLVVDKYFIAQKL